MHNKVDISENRLFSLYPEVLEKLLEDHASHENIYWATDSYSSKGEGYQFFDKITVDRITGENGKVIRPRSLKTKEEQLGRTKDKGEVFTPSWVCNAQNNLIDEVWFGESDVFNIQKATSCSWRTKTRKLMFPTKTGKTWQDYVCDTRLEITCGEAPYLVSRYDTTTGNPISLHKRIGILDRKLRIVGENTNSQEDWLLWAYAALKSIYGFEWQGDNLLLARESILFSFIDYYEDFATKQKFECKKLSRSCILHAADIISWNLFQMDGLKMVLPLSCQNTVITEYDSLYEGSKVNHMSCPGCTKNDIHIHNGIKQVVADWKKDEWSFNETPISVEQFHKLMN